MINGSPSNIGNERYTLVLYFFKKIKDEYDKKIEEAALEIALTKPEADLLLFLSLDK